MCFAIREAIMKKVALLSLLVFPFATACSPEPSSTYSDTSTTTTQNSSEHSSSFATSELSASMSAQSDGTTLKIYAAVFDVSTSFGVTLDEGDFFTASTGAGDPLVLVLEPSSDPTVVHYSASLPASTSAQDVTIAFVRQNGQTGAPRSVIHVPAAFAFAQSPPSIGMNAWFSIQVTPALTDAVTLEATGDCLEDDEDGYNPNTFANLIFDANGNASIDTSELLFADDDPSVNAGCAISFFVSDVVAGTLDPAFAGGASGNMDVEGLQKRGFQTVLAR
jgi:hypothetical protein